MGKLVCPRPSFAKPRPTLPKPGIPIPGSARHDPIASHPIFPTLKPPMHTQYDGDDVERVIATLVDQIATAFSPDNPLGIIGIRTRGEVLAERLTQALKARGFDRIERGTLDITLYRDD